MSSDEEFAEYLRQSRRSQRHDTLVYRGVMIITAVVLVAVLSLTGYGEWLKIQDQMKTKNAATNAALSEDR